MIQNYFVKIRLITFILCVYIYNPYTDIHIYTYTTHTHIAATERLLTAVLIVLKPQII